MNDPKATEKDVTKALARLLRVARHARNLYMPAENGLTIESVRREAVEAEIEVEHLIGKAEFDKICKIAFR